MKMIGILVAAGALLLSSVSLASAQQAASDADAVKRIVEASIAAFNAEKLDDVLALYAEDARIDSKAAGAQISKAQYREAMAKVLAQRSVSRSDVGGLKVAMIDGDRAIVEGVVYIYLASGGRGGGKNQWKLEKRDGRWLIVETKYQ